MDTVYRVNTTVFIANNAHVYGGAVYVDNDTNSGTCASSSNMECFFQVIALYFYHHQKFFAIYFAQNHANISGSTLYMEDY